MTFQKIGNLFMEEKKVLILWISVIGPDSIRKSTGGGKKLERAKFIWLFGYD